MSIYNRSAVIHPQVSVMLDQLLQPAAVTRLRASLFGPWLEAYAACLHERGIVDKLIRCYVYAVEHFGCWLKRRHIAPADIGLQTIREFLHNHLPKCRCVHPTATHLRGKELIHVRAALHHLLQLPPFVENAKATMAPPSKTDVLVAEFDGFLLQVAGLAEETRRERRRAARDFMKEAASRGAVNWTKLQPREVAVIFSRYVAHLRPASICGAASCVRSFLRFLRTTGRCDRDLTGAIHSMPRRSLASLPRFLSEKQLRAFFRHFERRTRRGRRDYAMALCMVELGLRTSEVVALRLDDVNWRAGTLRVVGGKNRRDRELPLPQAIGQAITAYLQKGRLKSASRHLFLHYRRFFKGESLTSSQVHRIMGHALKKVPGYEHFKGAHVLRHTAATRLFQRGVPLKIVADVLGHRSIDTTQIYTKVDVPTLANVALPWPEVLP